jgi:ABC-type multidrug transport system ATPase subunit
VTYQSSLSSTTSEPLRVDAVALRQTVGRNGEKVLIDDISLSILPGDFVAFGGGSGFGKSTLLDALNGFRPAGQGHVLVNGADYYASMSDYKHRLGYVPQDDIIHRELTVEDALYFTARLRLPSNTRMEQVRARVDEALEEVEMVSQRTQQIAKLSGGQRKRVSIASELISRPGLLYLDEPTSGLDPVLERRLMLLLRRLADEGRTVIAVTHATANIDVCDKVAFLARGGRLCFFGSPDDALEFFGAPNITSIYDMLETPDGAPEQWEREYRVSRFYDRYVREPQKEVALDGFPVASVRAHEIDEGTGASIAEIPEPTAASTSMSPLRQFLILTHRYATLLWTDKLTLGLMVSALSTNVALATAAAPLLVAPQMLLGGFVLPVAGAAEVMSYGMVGNWSSKAMGTTAELNRLYYDTIEQDPEAFQDNPLLEQVNFDPDNYDTDPRPKGEAQSRTDRRPRLVTYWGILSGMMVLFLAGTLFFQWRKDRGWGR